MNYRLIVWVTDCTRDGKKREKGEGKREKEKGKREKGKGKKHVSRKDAKNAEENQHFVQKHTTVESVITSYIVFLCGLLRVTPMAIYLLTPISHGAISLRESLCAFAPWREVG